MQPEGIKTGLMEGPREVQVIDLNLPLTATQARLVVFGADCTGVPARLPVMFDMSCKLWYP